MRKYLAIVLSVIVILGIFQSSTFAAGKKLQEIKILTMASPAGEKYNEVFSKFEKYGFKVIVEQVPWVTYLEKAQLATKSKVCPYDVINTNVEWVLPAYVMSGEVLPLNQFMKKDELKLKEFLPLTLNNVYWPKNSKYKPSGIYTNWANGLLYGVPSLSDSTPLTYRKDWFAEAGIAGPPKTWEEFLDVCKKMTKDTNGDGVPDRYGYAFAAIPEGGQLSDYWMMFVYSWGADLLTEDFKPAFNNRNGIEATQFMADLLHKHKVVPPGVLTYGIPQAFDAYKKGITAMTTQWGYALASVEDANESMAAGKSGYAAPPSRDRVGARFAQWAYTIPKNARNPKASWNFIKAASSLTAQGDLLPAVPPSRRKAAELAIKRYPQSYLAGLMQTISSSDVSIKPQIPNILEVDAAVSYPVFDAISGKTSVKEALQTAAQAALRAIEKAGLK